MEIALYLEINIAGIFIACVLIRSVQQSSSSTLHERILLTFLKLLILVLAADCLTRISDGWAFPGSYILGVLSNACVFSFGTVSALLWLLYVECRIHNDVERLRRRIFIYGLPAAFVTVLAALSQPFHLIYYIDADCVYHRGSWFLIQALAELSYLAYSVLLAMKSAKAERLQARRQEYRQMVLFGLFPLVGSAVEVMFYGLPVIWPFTVCAMLMVVMNLQKNQIAADALTGLNNRGRLDQYLAEQTKEFDPYQTLYMILMDVDHFKTVNDTYGHAVGDMALIRIAEVLKRATAKSGDFVARYGGDEFSVICRRRSDEEVEKIEKMIRAELRADNLTVSEDEPKLALSMGFAALPRGRGEDAIERLIASADAKMYEAKRLRHKMETWGQSGTESKPDAQNPEKGDAAMPVQAKR